MSMRKLPLSRVVIINNVKAATIMCLIYLLLGFPYRDVINGDYGLMRIALLFCTIRMLVAFPVFVIAGLSTYISCRDLKLHPYISAPTFLLIMVPIVSFVSHYALAIKKHSDAPIQMWIEGWLSVIALAFIAAIVIGIPNAMLLRKRLDLNSDES